LLVHNTEIHAAAAKCRNNPDYRHNSNAKRSCQWIQRNSRRERYCKHIEVHENCPQTCGVCCKDDPRYRLGTIGGKKLPCEWIAGSIYRKTRWCGVYREGRKVQDACPITCNSCQRLIEHSIVESSSPSENPTTTSSNTPTGKPSKKPNILLILGDDVGTGDIPMYWNSGLVDMPNIQKLANMGVTFKDAHSTPLCSPSRYMLLSGNYPHRGQYPSGTWNLGGEQNQFQWFQKSVADTLKEGGEYSTAMYGKWHIGGKIPLKENGIVNASHNHLLSNADHDWSQALIDGPQDTGFASSLITTAGIQSFPYSYFRDGFLTTKISDVKYWEHGNYSMPHGTSFIGKHGEGDPDWDSTAYNMIVVNETASFIDAHMVSDRSEDPWFVYAALGAVHGPHSPPDYYLDGTPIASTHHSRHMDMLYEMDKAVGSLVKIVEDRGLAKNTIIIFTSDNGGIRQEKSESYGHNSHGPLRGWKGDVYEGGHRVPMIFRYDDQFPINETRNHMVGLNDIYRTLCDLTGVPVPETSAQDSVSFADYIFSESNVEGLRKYLATWMYKKKSGITQVAEAIRFGSMKLIKYHGQEETTELYDLDNDLGEEFNLLTPNMTFPIMTEQMSKKLNSVGPCPDDQRSFIMKSGPAKGKRKTCDFFSSKRTRCSDGIYLEGETMCNSICGRHKNHCSKHYVPIVNALQELSE